MPAALCARRAGSARGEHDPAGDQRCKGAAPGRSVSCGHGLGTAYGTAVSGALAGTIIAQPASRRTDPVPPWSPVELGEPGLQERSLHVVAGEQKRRFEGQSCLGDAVQAAEEVGAGGREVGVTG